jgi:hypothetical protein
MVAKSRCEFWASLLLLKTYSLRSLFVVTIDFFIYV